MASRQPKTQDTWDGWMSGPLVNIWWVVGLPALFVLSAVFSGLFFAALIPPMADDERVWLLALGVAAAIAGIACGVSLRHPAPRPEPAPPPSDPPKQLPWDPRHPAWTPHDDPRPARDVWRRRPGDRRP